MKTRKKSIIVSLILISLLIATIIVLKVGLIYGLLIILNIIVIFGSVAMIKLDSKDEKDPLFGFIMLAITGSTFIFLVVQILGI